MINSQLTFKETEAIRHIRNWLVNFGRPPSVRQLQKAMKYSSPRSTSLIFSSLIKKGILRRRPNGLIQLINDPEEERNNARTVEVPLIGNIACGTPILAQECIEAMIPISKNFIQPGRRYFLLQAKGDSMTGVGINEGDFVLVKQQPDAKNGDIVVALIDDEATLKEFRRSSDAIILRPHNKKYHPIILRKDFQVQGVVVAKGLDLQ